MSHPPPPIHHKAYGFHLQHTLQINPHFSICQNGKPVISCLAIYFTGLLSLLVTIFFSWYIIEGNPCGPVVRTLNFHARDHGFDPWFLGLGIKIPTSCVMWPKKKKKVIIHWMLIKVSYTEFLRLTEVRSYTSLYYYFRSYKLAHTQYKIESKSRLNSQLWLNSNIYDVISRILL